MFDIDTNVDNLSREVTYNIKSLPSVNHLSRIIKKGLRLEKKGYTVKYKYGNDREIGQQLKLAAVKVSNQFDYTTPKKIAWGIGGFVVIDQVLANIHNHIYDLGISIKDSGTEERYASLYGEGLTKEAAMLFDNSCGGLMLLMIGIGLGATYYNYKISNITKPQKESLQKLLDIPTKKFD
jgi:hypothetical protein